MTLSCYFSACSRITHEFWIFICALAQWQTLAKRVPVTAKPREQRASAREENPRTTRTIARE
jgi:hypothetical protein